MISCYLPADDLEFIFRQKFTEGGYVGLNREIAQGSRLRLALSSGCANWDELLMMKRAVPRGLLSVGVVIDDLVCLQKVLASQVGSLQDGSLASESARPMELIDAEYHRVNLPTNEKKAFNHATLGSLWGVQVDGENLRALCGPTNPERGPFIW